MSASKEDKVIEIFFEYPMKHLNFKEIVELSGLHRENVSKWLFKLSRQKIIIRVKPKGRFPYYKANIDSPRYRNLKRIFALKKLDSIGLFDHLHGLNVKAAIIFGSFARSDWHKGSDIDLFIYGKADLSGIEYYERKIFREIEIIHCRDAKVLRSLDPYLLSNIISGYYVKGSLPMELFGPCIQKIYTKDALKKET